MPRILRALTAAREWAEWYSAAGGSNAALVARWAAYISRSK
jgi:hypothetical protein